MGGWHLEIGKMALYMTFPVALFHIFNQPAYFEEWVTKTKRDIYPPDSESHRKELEDAIKMIRAKQEEKQMKAFEEIENKRKH
ncbi:protein PET100 homolog, mitochondrial [Episyrphus balteatus]|uniref:protein PET100 homolog, mitochondrial n=1 Tax=Episyrphus balteatus TaxID=286459 RepID=UPI00248683D5|nr:protein PET100 homolog, mitochondrial [Episyrphus balteatus]